MHVRAHGGGAASIAVEDIARPLASCVGRVCASQLEISPYVVCFFVIQLSTYIELVAQSIEPLSRWLVCVMLSTN